MSLRTVDLPMAPLRAAASSAARYLQEFALAACQALSAIAVSLRFRCAFPCFGSRRWLCSSERAWHREEEEPAMCSIAGFPATLLGLLTR